MKAQVLDLHRMASEVCRLSKQWGLYVSGGMWDFMQSDGDYRVKASPYLSMGDHAQVVSDGRGLLLCETEDECRRLYVLTVGDDGPTAANPYDGTDRVYAMVIDADGVVVTENT